MFSSEMVVAVLQRRKTETRRIVKPQPVDLAEALRDIPGENRWWCATKTYDIRSGVTFLNPGSDYQHDWKCPYGMVGDHLWMRCNYRLSYDEYRNEAFWTALDVPGKCTVTHGRPLRNDSKPMRLGWKPSMHMPYWLSAELFPSLEITEIRGERLKDIGGRDAEAEGCEPDWDEFEGETQRDRRNYATVLAFRKLWRKINGPDSWDANPMVWVVAFKPV